jgi:hypothetical protein
MKRDEVTEEKCATSSFSDYILQPTLIERFKKYSAQHIPDTEGTKHAYMFLGSHESM